MVKKTEKIDIDPVKLDHFLTVQKYLLLVRESIVETSDLKDIFSYIPLKLTNDALKALSCLDPRPNEQDSDIFIPPF